MKRLSALLILAGAGLSLTPASVSAQFGPPGLSPLRPLTPLTPLPSLSPLPSLGGNPFQYVPRYGYSTGFQFSGQTLFGNTTFGYRTTYYGIHPPFVSSPYLLTGVASYYGQGGSFMTAGSIIRPDYVVAAQRNLARAQRQAALPGAKAEISGQWNYEKGTGSMPDTEAPALPEPVRGAVAPTDPAMITSGEALNALLKEIIQLEAKGAKGPSAYIPPLLLKDIQFGGSEAAELLNLARQAGILKFPSAFDDQALALSVIEVEKDFATVALAVQAGKSPERDKLLSLEMSFQRLYDAVTPIIKNLPFDDATAARRFLNQMTSAIKALKSGVGNGLIDPKWAAEGLTVSDLTKHMAKHKLQFGPALRGADEAYAILHQNLATYLFVLNQPKK